MHLKSLHFETEISLYKANKIPKFASCKYHIPRDESENVLSAIDSKEADKPLSHSPLTVDIEGTHV